MNASHEFIESPKPPRAGKPARPHDAERRTSVLLHAVAVAAVATAVFTGITAWETHQERVNTKTVYCNFTADVELDPGAQELSDQLGC